MSKPNFDYGPTPFSPCSFDYQPGTPDNRVSFLHKNWARSERAEMLKIRVPK